MPSPDIQNDVRLEAAHHRLREKTLRFPHNADMSCLSPSNLRPTWAFFNVREMMYLFL